jgi:LPXTG-motif cell wall-anchored protein
MLKKFNLGRISAFISFVLVFSLAFSLGIAAVEDSPAAGGLIVDEVPVTNEVTVTIESPAADEELAEGEWADEEFGEEEPADDGEDLFADVETEVPAEQFVPKSNPKTGDNTMLFVILAALSLAGAGVYFTKRSKKAR